MLAGVHPDLDRLRLSYEELPNILQETAEFERDRLTSLITIHRLGDSVDALTICYVCAPQSIEVIRSNIFGISTPLMTACVQTSAWVLAQAADTRRHATGLEQCGVESAI